MTGAIEGEELCMGHPAGGVLPLAPDWEVDGIAGWPAGMPSVEAEEDDVVEPIFHFMLMIDN